MKTLSTPVTNEAAADLGGWAEVYDIYLKAAITTPFGSTDTIRITTLPGGLSFFTPQFDPEPAGTQGDAGDYSHWPLTRQAVRSDGKSTNDKFTFAASNVSTEWADMLADVDWYDTPVVVRKVPHLLAGLTADDCAILFIGLVDSVRVTNEQLQFTCSNSLANLSSIAPRENMHQNCRFGWADDLCTQIRFKPENYDAKACGAASTTTLVKSADLTEDAGNSAGYGTDIVNALADGAITASDQRAAHAGTAVTASAFYDALMFAAAHNLQQGEPFTLAGTTPPSPLSFGTTYYAGIYTANWIRVHTTPVSGGPGIDITSGGTAVTLSTPVNYSGYQVRSANAGYWQLNSNADWGTLSHGYWQIPDAQAGIANAELKPYLQFDFGSAKTPRLWRLQSLSGATRLEDMARLVVFFSSSDAATWAHEGYFELPPVGGVLYDFFMPKASTKRYWRICIRTRWATSFSPKMLEEVQAYENGRNWWRNGLLKFDAATATAALRNISRKVTASYSGECVVATLPAVPAAGDTFVIERGCGRTFNDCCERRNWENFGGFTDLPNQTIIR